VVRVVSSGGSLFQWWVSLSLSRIVFSAELICVLMFISLLPDDFSARCRFQWWVSFPPLGVISVVLGVVFIAPCHFQRWVSFSVVVGVDFSGGSRFQRWVSFSVLSVVSGVQSPFHRLVSFSSPAVDFSAWCRFQRWVVIFSADCRFQC
jgi:hypothetical protein